MFLARSLSYSSIPAYLNVIRIIHLEAGFENPLSTWLLTSLLKGVKRTINKPAKQKLPITLDILKKIHLVLDLTTSIHKTFWASCLVAFYAFLRKATLLPKSKKDSKIICVSDLQFSSSGALLSIRFTKTIQNQDRILQIPLPKLHSYSPLCPVQALEDMLQDLNSKPGDPLFCYYNGKNLLPLTHDIFVKLLKSSIRLCGYDEKLYSGHSFRRGGATHAFASNISPLLIKAQGDWKSDAYLRYVDIPMQLRWQMMYKMANSAIQ